MISSQPAVPLLVHEDCMEGVHLDLAKQQESLSKIASNTLQTNSKLNDLSDLQITTNGILNGITIDIGEIGANTSSIKTSSSNTATATSSLYSSVGTTADASSSNTVIGLLKSIVNKLSL